MLKRYRRCWWWLAPCLVCILGGGVALTAYCSGEQTYTFAMQITTGSPQTAGMAIYRNTTVFAEYVADGLPARVPPLDFAPWVAGKHPQFVSSPATAALWAQLTAANPGLSADAVRFEVCWGHFAELTGPCEQQAPQQFPALACSAQLERMAAAAAGTLPPYATVCEVRVTWSVPIAGLPVVPADVTACLTWVD